MPFRKSRTILLCAAAALAAAAAFWRLTGARSEAERGERVSWAALRAMTAAGDHNGALSLLDGRIAARPRNGLLRYFKARVLYDKGDYYDALAENEAALRLGYPRTAALALKGVIYGRKLGDRRRQAEYCSKALSLDPSDEEAYLLRAEALAALGDFRGAEKDLTSYLAFYPGDADALADRAAARLGLGNCAAALADADGALRHDRKNDYAHYIAGRCLAERKDHKGAAERFTSAIRLDPERYEYYLGRAAAYGELNDFYDAAWDYSTAMAAPAVNCCASYYYLLGSSMYRVDESSQALSAAERALRLGGERPEYLELRARALAQAGRHEEAARDFKRLAALDPASAAEAGDFLRRRGGGRK